MANFCVQTLLCVHAARTPAHRCMNEQAYSGLEAAVDNYGNLQRKHNPPVVATAPACFSHHVPDARNWQHVPSFGPATSMLMTHMAIHKK